MPNTKTRKPDDIDQQASLQSAGLKVNQHGYVLTDHRLALYGLCPKCGASKAKGRRGVGPPAIVLVAGASLSVMPRKHR